MVVKVDYYIVLYVLTIKPVVHAAFRVNVGSVESDKRLSLRVGFFQSLYSFEKVNIDEASDLSVCLSVRRQSYQKLLYQV